MEHKTAYIPVQQEDGAFKSSILLLPLFHSAPFSFTFAQNNICWENVLQCIDSFRNGPEQYHQHCWKPVDRNSDIPRWILVDMCGLWRCSGQPWPERHMRGTCVALPIKRAAIRCSWTCRGVSPTFISWSLITRYRLCCQNGTMSK